MPRVRKSRSKVYEDDEALLGSGGDDGHQFACPYTPFDEHGEHTGSTQTSSQSPSAARAALGAGSGGNGHGSGSGSVRQHGVGGASRGPRGVPSGGLRWAVYAGVVLFLGVAAFVLLATRGELDPSSPHNVWIIFRLRSLCVLSLCLRSVFAVIVGELGRLLANNTPANFVYVMLMQLTLLVWLIALVFRVMEAHK